MEIALIIQFSLFDKKGKDLKTTADAAMSRGIMRGTLLIENVTTTILDVLTWRKQLWRKPVGAQHTE